MRNVRFGRNSLLVATAALTCGCELASLTVYLGDVIAITGDYPTINAGDIDPGDDTKEESKEKEQAPGSGSEQLRAPIKFSCTDALVALRLTKASSGYDGEPIGAPVSVTHRQFRLVEDVLQILGDPETKQELQRAMLSAAEELTENGSQNDKQVLTSHIGPFVSPRFLPLTQNDADKLGRVVERVLEVQKILCFGADRSAGITE